MIKKILIIVIALTITIITSYLIVTYHIKNKTNEIICNTSYKDDNYSIKTKVIINYKNNKVINHEITEEITSDNKDILELQKKEYDKNKYKTKLNNNKLISNKSLSNNNTPKKLLNNYLNNGYKCIGDKL